LLYRSAFGIGLSDHPTPLPDPREPRRLAHARPE
jgi:hypothetical protein